jgi:hypothetical protein
MQVSLLDRETTTPKSATLAVEMRAATLAEIRGIDINRREEALPAYLLMTEAQWRRSIEPYTRERRHPTIEDRHGPPGSLVWAQAASRAGHVMVGGRDRLGFPSFPVPGPGGVIRFESLESSNVDLSTEDGIPIVRGSVLRDGSSICTPMIGTDDVVTCGSRDCGECLHSMSLSTWQSAIACMCPEHP